MMINDGLGEPLHLFNKLTLDQIANSWPYLKGFILEAVGTGDYFYDAKLGKEILDQLLLERADCWVAYKSDLEKKTVTPFAVIVTICNVPVLGGEKEMFIYSATAFDSIAAGTPGEDVMKSSFEALLKYAKAQGCKKIVAYSKAARLIKLFASYGGDTSMRYLSLNLEV